jgi:hypothetical protein
MSPFSDEELVAYADGDLAAERATEIARAQSNDPQLTARIQALVEARRAAPAPAAAPPEGAEADFAPGRTPLAIAVAVLVVLAAAAWYLLRPTVESEEALINKALETTPTGVPLVSLNAQVMPLSTLQTDNGLTCREYEARSGPAGSGKKHRGLACRTGEGRWETKATAAENERVAGAEMVYVAAPGGSDSLASILGQAKQLSREEEQAQINAHWTGGK